MTYSKSDYLWGVLLGTTLGLNVTTLVNTTTRPAQPTKIVQLDINRDGYKDLIIYDKQKNEYIFLGQPDGSYKSLKSVQKAEARAERD
ncbi:MAG: hypothetical protein AABW41_00310 [Nanoarchaeota archaeon]